MNMMKRNWIFGLLLLASTVLMAQRGKDGAKVISGAGQILNEYTVLTADAAAGSNLLQVAGSALNTNNRFGYNLSPGDLLMIIQVQGATIDGGTWWFNFGYISAYNNCGLYEMAEVASVPGGTSIQLNCPLQYNYTASGRVQVIRVPRITDLTVNNGGSISCDAWNGSAGGVLVLEVSGNTVISSGGSLNVSGRGFRGGVNSDVNATTGASMYASTNNYEGAEKGEGIAGYVTDYDLIGGRYCKNAAANGGGGGNAHNGGGGGGANAGFRNYWNGHGNPDTSQPGWILAWELESPGFHNNQTDGGGRGGYTYSWNNLDATVTGPNNAAWGGDNRRNEGGQGGRALDYSSGRLFLGGGGGAGDQGDGTDYGGDGGNGGGMIFLLCYGSVSGSGECMANGNAGQDAQGTPPWNGHAGIDAGGGGGAGGTVVIRAQSIAATLTIRANGGDGGDQIKTKTIIAPANGEAEGPGGGGGGGYIAVSAGSPLRQVNGGVNGISYAQTSADNGVEEFPPNGATKGGAGIGNALVSFVTLMAAGDSVCPGDTAILTAWWNGTPPPGTQIQWFDQEVGGNLLGTGDTLWLGNLSDTTVVYAGACPGTYRIAVNVIVYPAGAEAGPDLYLCNGSSDTLQASGGISYLWTPVTFLSDSSIANPVVSAPVTTEYFVYATNSYGCPGLDSVMVFVNMVVAGISNDTAICEGSTVLLKGAGGTDYLWSTGDTTATVSVIPLVSQTYFLTVSTGNCSDTASVSITLNPLPVPDLGHDTAFCEGGSLLLDAGYPGSSYLWQDLSVAQTFLVSVGGTYSVTVTTPEGCSASDDILVQVPAWANAAISPVSPVCQNSPVFNLNAADPGGIWWGTGIIDPVSGSFDPAGLSAAAYTVFYGIPGMCGDTSSVQVLVMEMPAITLLSRSESCTGANDAGIEALVSGGEQPYVYLWSNGSDSAVIFMLAPGVYSLSVTDSNLCAASASLLITASDYPCYTPHYYIPNIFSPNGDGVNDIFMVRGAGILAFDMVIYDRWGKKVFESADPATGWDGTNGSADYESGVYYYYVNLTLEGAEPVKAKGSISLVR